MMRSIRTRLLALIIGIAVLTILVFASIMIRGQASTAREEAMQQQLLSSRVALLLLANEKSAVTVDFSQSGERTRISWTDRPDFSDHGVVDQFLAISGDGATIFVYDSERNDFLRVSTNIRGADGERLDGTYLGSDSAAYAPLMAGQSYRGEALVLGVPFLTYYKPILGPDGEIDGVIAVANSLEAVNGAVTSGILNTLGIAAVIITVASVLSVVLLRGIINSLSAVGKAMGRVVSGDWTTEIPAIGRTDEIGDMARSIQQFRDSAVEADRRRALDAEQVERAERENSELLATLERRAGRVVAAAMSGDFTQRVEGEFSAAEMSSLASGINQICAQMEEFLNHLEKALSALSEGRMNHRMGTQFGGRLDELAREVNSTFGVLSTIVTDISRSGQEIDEATRDISSAANEQAQRADAQAASLEETSATMEEISRTVSSNAAGAKEATSLAIKARQEAETCSRVVGETVTAMETISAGSRRIGEIISVIESIAMQTNLLALNAAVEAARAGEAGAGFAVVAAEVRTLAQRSSSAAQDIGQLIEESGVQVQEGVRLVEATGNALKGVVDLVGQVDPMMNEIARASSEQATAVSEITSTVAHLDEATQVSASLAARAAAAVETLVDRRKRLDAIVARFSGLDSRSLSAGKRSHSTAA